MSIIRALVLIAVNSFVVFWLGMRHLAPAFGLTRSTMFSWSVPFVGFLLTLAAFGALVLVAWASVTGLRRSWHAAGWHTQSLGGQLLRGAMGTGLAVAATIGMLLVAGTPWAMMKSIITGWPLAQRVLFVAVGVQAAFIEETLFRGNLLGALQQRLPYAASIIITSAVFAAYHQQWAWQALVGKFAVGVAFAVARHRNGGLWGSAFAHAATWAIVGPL